MSYKLVITGSSGFVNQKIIFSSIFKKYDLTILTRKKLKKNTFIRLDLSKKIPKKNLPIFFNSKDWIIHTSSYHKINSFQNRPRLKMMKNILMTKNVIKICKANDIKNIIFFSTSDIDNLNYNKKKYFYVKSKIICENILQLLYKKKIFEKIVILRCPAIVGKNRNKIFLYDLIDNIKKKKNIKIWNYNLPYKFVDVDDLLKLIKFLIENYKKKRFFKIIDCQSKNLKSIVELSYFFKKKFKSSSKIIQSDNFLYKNNPNIKKRKFNFSFSDSKKVLTKYFL